MRASLVQAPCVQPCGWRNPLEMPSCPIRHAALRASCNPDRRFRMSIRIATATAIVLAFAAPAFADCKQELAALDQPVVSAETGAATNKSGMPATEHQEQVLP